MAVQESLPEATIKDCASRRLIISIVSDTNVQEAATLMKDRDVRSILVKEKDEYIGIVTETDILFEVLIGGNVPNTTKVSSIMTKPIISLDQDKPLKEAIELMRNKNIKHLVVTRKDEIIGMLSVRDLITFAVKNR